MTITPELLAQVAGNGRRPVIVEAGAHYGEDTARFARCCARVYAFEPIPILYQKVIGAVRECENVTTYPQALSSREGKQEMWASGPAPDDGSSSLREPKEHLRCYEAITFPDKVTVPVTTLDAWAKREQVRHVDGLWLDLQGEELEALKGAASLLPHVKAMVLEFSTDELYEGIPLWDELQEWLRKAGFKVALEEYETMNALVTRR